MSFFRFFTCFLRGIRGGDGRNVPDGRPTPPVACATNYPLSKTLGPALAVLESNSIGISRGFLVSSLEIKAVSAVEVSRAGTRSPILAQASFFAHAHVDYTNIWRGAREITSVNKGSPCFPLLTPLHVLFAPREQQLLQQLIVIDEAELVQEAVSSTVESNPSQKDSDNTLEFDETLAVRRSPLKCLAESPFPFMDSAYSEGGDNDKESDRSFEDASLHESSDGYEDLPSLIPSPYGFTYTTIMRLGEGCSAFAMYAKTEYGCPVAIKVFDKAYLSYKATHAGTEGFLMGPTPEQLKTEVDNYKTITEKMKSRYLVPLLEAFTDEKNMYLVMPMYPSTLRDLIYPGETRILNLKWIQLISAELVVAVEELHRMRIFHRDIKPDNILITPTGHAALADFGLAKHVPCPKKQRPPSFRSEKFHEICGTAEYSDPDLNFLRLPDTRANRVGGVRGVPADIWAIGCVMYEMFAEKFYMVENEAPTEWAAAIDDIPTRTEYKDGSEESDELIQLAQNLLKAILKLRPLQRPTICTIQADPFFREIDWDKLKEGGFDEISLVTPPLEPRLRGSHKRGVDRCSSYQILDSNYNPAEEAQIANQVQFNERLGDISYLCPPGISLRHGFPGN